MNNKAAAIRARNVRDQTMKLRFVIDVDNVQATAGASIGSIGRA